MTEAAESIEKETPYFIGVGASAGGLEAATGLAKNLPKSVNAVYILAQHMSPKHKVCW